MEPPLEVKIPKPGSSLAKILEQSPQRMQSVRNRNAHSSSSESEDSYDSADSGSFASDDEFIVFEQLPEHVLQERSRHARQLWMSKMGFLMNNNKVRSACCELGAMRRGGIECST